MDTGRKWFFICFVLALAVGFLAGIIVSPLIMRPGFGPRMEMKRDKGMPPMGFEMGPGRHGGLPRGPMGDKGMGGKAMGDKGMDSRIKDFIIEDMGRELSLSADQKKQLRKIFDQFEPEQLKFHKEMQTQMETLRKKMDSQILKILDDKQKVKFKEFTSGFNKDNRHMPPGVDGHSRDMDRP
jgi:hypothetical protein